MIIHPRVAIVSRYPPRGELHAGRGLASYAKNLAINLAALDIQVTVIAESLNNNGTAYEEQGVVVRRVWSGGRDTPALIRSAVARSGADVVHLQHELFMFGPRLRGLLPAAVLSAIPSNVSRVVTLHGIVAPEEMGPSFVRDYVGPFVPPRLVRCAYGLTMRQVVRAAQRSIVHSDALATNLRAYCPDSSPYVIPHGVSPRLALPHRSLARQNLGLSPGPKAVFFGFLLPYKGLSTLEAAAPYLRREGIEVVVAGGPSGDRQPTHQIRNYSDNGGTVRLGYIPENLVPSVLAVADVLVLPYDVGISASGPLALAAAHGVPVVVSDVATLAGVVKLPAAIFPRGNATALAARVASAIFDPLVRADILATLEDLASASAWDLVAEQTIGVYEAARAQSMRRTVTNDGNEN